MDPRGGTTFAAGLIAWSPATATFFGAELAHGEKTCGGFMCTVYRPNSLTKQIQPIYTPPNISSNQVESNVTPMTMKVHECDFVPSFGAKIHHKKTRHGNGWVFQRILHVFALSMIPGAFARPWANDTLQQKVGLLKIQRDVLGPPGTASATRHGASKQAEIGGARVTGNCNSFFCALKLVLKLTSELNEGEQICRQSTHST